MSSTEMVGGVLFLTVDRSEVIVKDTTGGDLTLRVRCIKSQKFNYFVGRSLWL